MLTGSEVKSLRAGNVALSDAYAALRGDELCLFNCRIGEYKAAAALRPRAAAGPQAAPEPGRDREAPRQGGAARLHARPHLRSTSRTAGPRWSWGWRAARPTRTGATHIAERESRARWTGPCPGSGADRRTCSPRLPPLPWWRPPSGRSAAGPSGSCYPGRGRAMFDRVKLRRDLTDCGGQAARPGGHGRSRSSRSPRRPPRPGPDSATPLSETFLADDLGDALARPGPTGTSSATDERPSRRCAASSSRPTLPQPLVEEMAAAKLARPGPLPARALHGGGDPRLILAAAGDGAGLARRSPRPRCSTTSGCATSRPGWCATADSLHGDDAVEVASAPAARRLPPGLRCSGSHPAVEAALAHHWRDGQGYPDLAEPRRRRPPRWWRWRAPSRR